MRRKDVYVCVGGGNLELKATSIVEDTKEKNSAQNMRVEKTRCPGKLGTKGRQVTITCPLPPPCLLMDELGCQARWLFCRAKDPQNWNNTEVLISCISGPRVSWDHPQP